MSNFLTGRTPSWERDPNPGIWTQQRVVYYDHPQAARDKAAAEEQSRKREQAVRKVRRSEELRINFLRNNLEMMIPIAIRLELPEMLIVVFTGKDYPEFLNDAKRCVDEVQAQDGRVYLRVLYGLFGSYRESLDLRPEFLLIHPELSRTVDGSLTDRDDQALNALNRHAAKRCSFLKAMADGDWF